MRVFIIVLMAIVVSSCAATRENTQRGISSAQFEMDESWRKIREYARWNRQPQPVVEQYVPSGYCYRTQGDIICYEEPLSAEAEGTRLVGYQEPIIVASNVKPSPYVKSPGFFDDMRNIRHARPVFLPDSMMGPWKGKSTPTSTGANPNATHNLALKASGDSMFVGSAPQVKGVGESAKKNTTSNLTTASAEPAKSTPASVATASTSDSSSSSAAPAVNTAMTPAVKKPLPKSAAADPFGPKELIPRF